MPEMAEADDGGMVREQGCKPEKAEADNYPGGSEYGLTPDDPNWTPWVDRFIRMYEQESNGELSRSLQEKLWPKFQRLTPATKHLLMIRSWSHPDVAVFIYALRAWARSLHLLSPNGEPPLWLIRATIDLLWMWKRVPRLVGRNFFLVPIRTPGLPPVLRELGQARTLAFTTKWEGEPLEDYANAALRSRTLNVHRQNSSMKFELGRNGPGR